MKTKILLLISPAVLLTLIIACMLYPRNKNEITDCPPVTLSNDPSDYNGSVITGSSLRNLLKELHAKSLPVAVSVSVDGSDLFIYSNPEDIDVMGTGLFDQIPLTERFVISISEDTEGNITGIKASSEEN